MKWKNDTQGRLYLCSAIILFAGLASSIFIILTAQDVYDTASGYEVEESKKYMRDLELYGGKSNVLAMELMKCFNGLWHGKSLAYTVGCITILISFGLFFVGYHSLSNLESDD